MVFSEALDQFDAERGKLLAHRRIYVGVATGNAVAGGTRDSGDAAHKRAANSEDVQVLGHGRAPILVDDL